MVRLPLLQRRAPGRHRPRAIGAQGLQALHGALLVGSAARRAGQSGARQGEPQGHDEPGAGGVDSQALRADGVDGHGPGLRHAVALPAGRPGAGAGKRRSPGPARCRTTARRAGRR